MRSAVDKLLFEGTPLRCVGVQVGKLQLFPKHGVISGAGALATHARLIKSKDCALLREQYPSWKQAGDLLGVSPGRSEVDSLNKAAVEPATTPTSLEGPHTLPPPYEDPSKTKMERPVYDPSKATIQMSTGHVYLFVALRGTQEELKLPTANSWVFNGLQKGWDQDEGNSSENTAELTPLDLPARSFHSIENADLK